MRPHDQDSFSMNLGLNNTLRNFLSFIAADFSVLLNFFFNFLGASLYIQSQG